MILTALCLLRSHGWHWLNRDPQSSASISASDRLHEIAKPTLIIVGEGDLPYFHNIANVLASNISGARKVVVPDAGHMVNMESPAKVNELLADFVSESKLL